MRSAENKHQKSRDNCELHDERTSRQGSLQMDRLQANAARQVRQEEIAGSRGRQAAVAQPQHAVAAAGEFEIVRDEDAGEGILAV